MKTQSLQFCKFQSKPEMDAIVFLVTVLLIFYVNVGIGVVCEIGQQIFDLFEDIIDKFDQIDWYPYPIEIKRTLPTVFGIAQKPVYLKFFGSITASKRFVLHQAIFELFSIEIIIIASFTFRS